MTPAEKLKQVLEMMDTGIRIQRANLRRENPQLDAAELERLFLSWLLSADDV